MLVSDPKGRDIKMDSFTLSFHGRLLIESAEVSLNYGQRYGLLGENGSGKVRHRASGRASRRFRPWTLLSILRVFISLLA